MELMTLQIYWWVLISVLAGVLVFMLFVQGGQTMLYCNTNNEARALMVNSLGRKWELTFTTLVVFGGAFFASFPLFYSTSFGGAYWLWMLILISFVVQAVSYEFRMKRGNLYTHYTYDAFLIFNGVAGCILLGVAVGTIFFGGEFTINKSNILDSGAPVISQWAATHGLEAIANWRNLLLGLSVLMLARTMGCLYFINDINDERGFGISNRIKVLTNGVAFVLLFIGFLVVLFSTTGLRADASGQLLPEANIYFNNLIDMWPLAIIFVLGVLSVVYAIMRTAFSTTWQAGIWWCGAGVVAVVVVLFLIAGLGGTAYYRSLSDPASSLTIANSSSSHFTLTAMSYASLVLPVVIAYIWYVWFKMNRKPLSPSDLKDVH